MVFCDIISIIQQGSLWAVGYTPKKEDALGCNIHKNKNSFGDIYEIYGLFLKIQIILKLMLCTLLASTVILF